jgi:hypothetical protein
MTLTTLLLVDLSVLLVSLLPWVNYDSVRSLKAPYRLRGRIQRNTITENASES